MGRIQTLVWHWKEGLGKNPVWWGYHLHGQLVDIVKCDTAPRKKRWERQRALWQEVNNLWGMMKLESPRYQVPACSCSQCFSNANPARCWQTGKKISSSTFETNFIWSVPSSSLGGNSIPSICWGNSDIFSIDDRTDESYSYLLPPSIYILPCTWKIAFTITH